MQHLTQTVLLDRHMAAVVHTYLANEQRSLLHRDVHKQRLSTTEALSLVPLAKLLKDLARLVERDKGRAPKKARPHQLKVPYAEMTTLRFYYARMLVSAASWPESYLVLQAALGRFHQPSLTLESHVALADATRLPGYQANMFA